MGYTLVSGLEFFRTAGANQHLFFSSLFSRLTGNDTYRSLTEGSVRSIINAPGDPVSREGVQ